MAGSPDSDPDRPQEATSVSRAEEPEPRAVVRTLLVTDLVGSTELVEKAGDAAASEISSRHDRLARQLLREHQGLEIDKTDGFLLLFERPAEAVGYALAYHNGLAELSRELAVVLEARAGIHLGEVILRHNPAEEVERGAKPIEVEGLAKPTAARLMGLARGGQTLLTRSAFDLARRAIVGSQDEALEWRAHGAYLFKGLGEPIEVFEVGIPGTAAFDPPTGGDKAQRSVSADEESTLGWRPAVGLTVPGREHWLLESQAGEGGFGEVWIAQHRKTKARRIFKFCFEPSRLRGLRREVVLFRLLKESLGNRDDIAQILDWQFDEAPYFLEAEYSDGGDLQSWAKDAGGLAAIPLDQRLEIVAQTAVALGAAHAVGVLHKDIKPANILIHGETNRKPKARLTDFGIGLVTDRGSLAASGVTVAGFTQTLLASSSKSGASAGTPMYIAPEVLSRQIATTLSDIYSLGVVLYQVVIGDTSRALAPGWEREIDDELLRQDIALCVDGDPSRRLRSADELAERLRSLDDRKREHENEQQRRRDAERFRRRRRQFGLASAVGIGLTLLVSVFAWRERARANEESRLRLAARKQLYLADMNRVAQAWEDGDLPRLLRHLEAHRPIDGEPDLREFAWYHWWRASHMAKATIQHGTSLVSPIFDLAASPDAKTVWLRLEHALIEAWDADPLRRKSRAGTALSNNGWFPMPASWSGQHLALYSSDIAGARLYNTETWQVDQNLSGSHPASSDEPAGQIVAAFSPSDARLATGDGRGRVAFWTASGPTAPFVGERTATVGGPVQGMVFSADGQRLFIAISLSEGAGTSLVVVDVATAQVVERLAGAGAPLAASPAGGWVASAGEGHLQVWSYARGSFEQLYQLPTGDPVTAIAFSPDGRRLAAGTTHNLVHVWELERLPHSPQTLVGHTQEITAALFVGNADTLWTADYGGVLRVWDLGNAEPFLTIPNIAVPRGGAPETTILSFAKKGEELLFRDETGRLRRFDLATRNVIKAPLDDESYLHFAVAEDGGTIAGITRRGTLRVVDASGEPLFDEVSVVDPTKTAYACDQRAACVQGLAVSVGGKKVAWTIHKGPFWGGETWQGDGFYLRDMRGARQVYIRGFAKKLRFSPDGERLAIERWSDGDVWDVTAEEPRHLFSWEEWAGQARPSFSPDGRFVATASGDRSIVLFDAETGDKSGVLLGHLAVVTTTAFSADGATLISGGHGGSVRLWDLETAQLRTTLRGHTGPVLEVAMAPDGRTLASVDDTGTGRVWLSASIEEGEDDLDDRLSRIPWGYDAGTLTEVLDEAGAIIADHPNDPRAYVGRGVRLAQGGRFEEALSDLDRAVDLGGTSVAVLAERAGTAANVGHWETVRDTADRLVELTRGDDSEADFLLLRAHSQARLGRLEEAHADAARALAQRPTAFFSARIQRVLGVGAVVPVAQRVPNAYDTLLPNGIYGSVAAQPSPVEWRYTTSTPDASWYAIDYDDSDWARGSTPFLEDPEVNPGTLWSHDAAEIWLRHTFTLDTATLDAMPEVSLRFLYRTYGQDVLYLNGQNLGRALVRGQWGYDSRVNYRRGFTVSATLLRPGKNVLAVHGERRDVNFLDIGLYKAYGVEEMATVLEARP